jgi:hypothetical protein
MPRAKIALRRSGPSWKYPSWKYPSKFSDFSSACAGFSSACAVTLLAVMSLSVSTLAARPQASRTSTARLKTDLRGAAATRDGRRLHLVLDLGNIVVHTQNSQKIDYTVHLETDASQKDAKELLKSFAVSSRETPEGVYLRGQTSPQSSGRLWVTVTVNVPKNYSLDLSTGGGNINTDDIGGPETVLTSGGNIVAGNIGGAARLVTGGGHITVNNVSGGLFANTGGGHITTGAVTGGAILRTSGGHIRMASVEGAAKLVTAGGNVTVEGENRRGRHSSDSRFRADRSGNGGWQHLSDTSGQRGESVDGSRCDYCVVCGAGKGAKPVRTTIERWRHRRISSATAASDD